MKIFRQNLENERVTKNGDERIAEFVLSESLIRGDAETLALLWQETTASVICRIPRGFEHGEWFGHAVRGAWGNRLLEIEKDWCGKPHGLLPSDALMGVHAKIGSNHIPPPYIFQWERQGDKMHVSLVLFGVANQWRDIAFEAFLLAFEKGLSIGPGSRIRPSWKILDSGWKEHNSISLKRYLPNRYAVFDTPFHPPGNKKNWEENFMIGLFTRIKGIARWQNYRLLPDNVTFLQMLDQLKISEVPHSDWLSVIRRSSRSSTHQFQISATYGMIEISRIPETVSPLLDIGSRTHWGENTNMAFGKYSLF